MNEIDLTTLFKKYEKVKRRNAYYREKGERVQMYQDGEYTIFEESAFFNKKENRWLTKSEIEDRVNNKHFQYQAKTIYNMAETNYVTNLFEVKQEGIVTLLNQMGAEDVADMVKNMTPNQFKNLWYKGGLNDVVEKYRSGVVEMASTGNGFATEEIEDLIVTLESNIPKTIKKYVESANWTENAIPYKDYIKSLRKAIE